MVDEQIKCTECKSIELFNDFKTGEVICKNCGLVQNVIVIKDEIYDY